MTHLYLAYAGECAPALRTIDWSLGVNLLVAYPYLLHYRKDAVDFAPARALLDSGAYSVTRAGRRSISMRSREKACARAGPRPRRST